MHTGFLTRRSPCILVNHFTHAADELGPGEPLAGRQLQAEGLQGAEEQCLCPASSHSCQLRAAQHPQLLPASTDTLPCKAPKPLLPAKTQCKNRRVV